MIRFSADKFPQRERFDAWREEFVLRIANSDMERLDHRSAPFKTEITNLPLGRLLFAHVRGTPVRMFREQRHVADGNADFTLVIARAARTHSISGDSETTAGASLLTYWRPASVSFTPTVGLHYEVYRYQVPRDLMEAVVDDPDARCFRPAPMNRAALDYLVQYTDQVLLKHDFTDARIIERTGVHVLDLVATILGPNRDAVEAARQRGLRAARLQAIIAYIDANLTNPKLDVAAVAKRHRVSTRHVQRLMEGQGETFSNYVLRRRLDRVATLLGDPTQKLRIGDIALACGFNDLSYFNRTFKRRFGESPRRYRRA
jgi:AraC-like DNA-binding protein